MALMTQEERFDELCDQVSKLAKEVAALAKIVQEIEEKGDLQKGGCDGHPVTKTKE